MLKPGRFTLLLGPPGGGKTTLLQALGGQLSEGEDGSKFRGSVHFNGERLDKFNAARTAVYVPQVGLRGHRVRLGAQGQTAGHTVRLGGTGRRKTMCITVATRQPSTALLPAHPTISTNPHGVQK